MKNIKKTVRQAAAILMNNRNYDYAREDGYYLPWKAAACHEAEKKGLRLEDGSYWAEPRVYVADLGHVIKNIRLEGGCIVVKLRYEDAMPELMINGLEVRYVLSSKA